MDIKMISSLVALFLLIAAGGGQWYVHLDDYGEHIIDYELTKAEAYLTRCINECQETCSNVPPEYFADCFDPCAQECKARYLP